MRIQVDFNELDGDKISWVVSTPRPSEMDTGDTVELYDEDGNSCQALLRRLTRGDLPFGKLEAHFVADMDTWTHGQ